MENLALAKMHVKPFLENTTSFSALASIVLAGLENADFDVNNRQSRTFSSPSLLTLLIAATLLAKASAKSHNGYPSLAPYRPAGYYNAPYDYHPTNHPHHHHHQLHAPPVNQQQIVNIHERPRPHGGSSSTTGMGAENFEDINEMNHQHIITTIQRPLEAIAEEMLGSEKVYSVVLPDSPNPNKNDTETYTNSSEDTTLEDTTYSVLPIATPPTTIVDDTEEPFQEITPKEGAETNLNYKRVRPEVLYLKSSGRRTTSRPIRRTNDSNYKRSSSSSKRGQKRPSTFSYYDYDDYPTTARPRSQRRRPTQRRPSSNKRRPGGLYDEYDYNSLESTTRINNRGPNRNKRRPVKNNHRRRPAGDSDSQYYSMEDDDFYRDDEYYDDPDLAPRQGTTSTTTDSTTSETTTASSTTTTTESTSTSTTTTGTPPTTGPTESSKPTGPTGPNGTYPGYGYGPGSGNDDISITYGPPGNQGGGYGNYDYGNGPSGAGYGPSQGNGYGPSQGNDNVGITYGPPGSLQQRLDYVAPLLDAWYAQYSAKNAVVRRIQELLHQNTQPQPQAQGDYANYNDNAY